MEHRQMNRQEVRKAFDIVHDCPYCGTSVALGYLVCLGCQAEVVYGSTKEEVQQDRWGGFMVGGGMILMMAWLFSHRLPVWSRGGMFIVLVLTLGVGMFFGYWYAQRKDHERRQAPPRFFREQRAARL